MSTRVTRHPVLGIFAGLIFGLGLALVLAVFGTIPTSVAWIGIVVGACLLLGLAAAYAAPARGR